MYPSLFKCASRFSFSVLYCYLYPSPPGTQLQPTNKM